MPSKAIRVFFRVLFIALILALIAYLSYLLVVALRSASPIYLLIFIVAIGMLVHILRKRNFPRRVLEKAYKAG